MGIFPIKEGTHFAYGAESPFPIDPGRKISGSKIIEFWRFEVCMHHLSYVRKDIRTKLLSAHARKGNLPVLDKIVDRYENYAFPQAGFWIDRELIFPLMQQSEHEILASARKTEFRAAYSRYLQVFVV